MTMSVFVNVIDINPHVLQQLLLQLSIRFRVLGNNIVELHENTKFGQFQENLMTFQTKCLSY